MICVQCLLYCVLTIAAALYADHIPVKTQMDQVESSNAFVRMVKSMFDTGKSAVAKQNNLLRQRNQILMSIYENLPGIKKLDGLTIINCSTNVHYILPKMFPKILYSYDRKKKCDQCDFELNSERCFVDINFSRFQELPIRKLNSCLLDCLISENHVRCACGGNRSVYHTEFSNFILIDLTVESTITEISLQDIPKNLNILKTAFELFGCIGFIGETAAPIDCNDDEDDNVDIRHYLS